MCVKDFTRALEWGFMPLARVGDTYATALNLVERNGVYGDGTHIGGLVLESRTHTGLSAALPAFSPI